MGLGGARQGFKGKIHSIPHLRDTFLLTIGTILFFVLFGIEKILIQVYNTVVIICYQRCKK